MAIYKRGRGFELGPTKKKYLKTQLEVTAGLELGAYRLQVQRPDHSATLHPHFALILVFFPTEIPNEELWIKLC